MVDYTSILLAIIAAAVTISTSYMARVSNTANRTLEATQQVHQIVNSNQTAMQKAVDDLTSQVLKLSTANATLLELKRTAELLEAKASGKEEAHQGSMQTAAVPPTAINVTVPEVNIVTPPGDVTVKPKND